MAAETKPRPPVAYVEWVDSSRGAGWMSVEHAIQQSLTCWSCGFLIDDGEESVTVATSIVDENDVCADAMTIPRCAIVSMHLLDFER